ncbi:MAG: glycoside hydrolase family 97 N-terminal domain-containing protein [Gemmatimonadaceae bacterium]
MENPVGARRRTVPDSHNEATIALRESRPPARRLNTVSHLRALANEGARRVPLVSRRAKRISPASSIAEERTGFSFPPVRAGAAPEHGRFNTHNEGEYTRTADAIKPTAVLNLPLLVEIPNGPWACVLEGRLNQLPRAPVESLRRRRFPCREALRTAESEGRGSGNRVDAVCYPWRVMVAATPGQLIEHNYLTLNPSTPRAAITFVGSSRQGRVGLVSGFGLRAAWTSSRAGMNTATMNISIDPAAAHRIEYKLVDAGWYKESTDREQGNLLEFFPQVNIPGHIIAYGTSKGVGVLLLAGRSGEPSTAVEGSTKPPPCSSAGAPRA